MSIETEALLQEAKESIEAAQNYRSELQQRLHGLSQARKQVRGSSSQTREALRRHFTDLQTVLTRLLSERLAALLQEVDAIEQESVSPLDDCEVAIRCGIGEKEDKLGSFTKKALQIQLDSVASHPPVQIEELVERPGSVLVRWCKYEDAYIGKETEFLVLHLDPHTDHLFRVCARGEGRTEWSPWSVPQTGYTTLAPHEWRPGSEGYILSSRRNIAMRTAGPMDKRDSVGVCVDCQSGVESLQRDKAVCISTNGAVFVNGKEMTNQLPAISIGSTVTFDMEVVNLFPISNNNLNDGGNFKLRVTIGSGNREVVFDWLLDQGVDSLFFGSSFAHPGWKVLVF
ncbi:hypothetical protein JZ751_013274 [Albula glossodonta]|uniref:Cytokine receptor-like factor 3 n=1 Tax=Albula glossodonta TaxID=121402 RepID=A0A8T2P5F0_9TELE|nr:hypothetical protein JZ751_013274 [Albula glossodonta]